jgi:hypothetical protein
MKCIQTGAEYEVTYRFQRADGPLLRRCGISLRAAVEGSPLQRRLVASELLYGDVTKAGQIIRTKRYKYIVFNSGARPEQLYLECDPGEMRNLARNKPAKPILIEHRRLFADWLRDTNDSFRPPPDYST